MDSQQQYIESAICLNRSVGNTLYHSVIPNDGATYEVWLCRKNVKNINNRSISVAKVTGAGITKDNTAEFNKFFLNLASAKTARPKKVLAAGSTQTEISSIYTEFLKMQKIPVEYRNGHQNLIHYRSGKCGWNLVFESKGIGGFQGYDVKPYGKLYLCIFRNGIPVSNLLRCIYNNGM